MSAKKAKRKKKTPQKPPTSQKSLKRRSSNLTPPNLQPQSKMQQTQDTPQPQDSQTQNPQNNSSNDNAYESIPVSSTALTDSNCLVIDEDEHNVTKDIFHDYTDDSSVKTTDKANDSDNCTDEDDFDLNNPKTFDESSKEDNPAPDKQQTRRYNRTVTVSLATTQQVVTYQKWNNQTIEELPREQRIAAKGSMPRLLMAHPPTQNFTLGKRKPPIRLVKMLRPFMVLMTVQMVGKPPLVL